MKLPTSNNVLWIVTHLLGALNGIVGLMLYTTTQETAPLKSGILITSRDDGYLDPVTIFFFRGEGALKLALSLFTLVLSKVVVSWGYATSEQATELSAACFLALLLPAIPVWYLNTDPAQADIFDASKFKERIVMSSVFCSILAFGLFQSYRKHADSERSTLSAIQKASVFFMATGVLFGVQLLWNPEANFGPNGIQPFFTSTGYKDDLFDPVMMYAGRMFGAAHAIFAAALWYFRFNAILVSVLIIATVAFFFPLDIMSAVDSEIMYRPMWIFIMIIHTACFICNYNVVTTTMHQSSNKKTS